MQPNYMDWKDYSKKADFFNLFYFQQQVRKQNCHKLFK